MTTKGVIYYTDNRPKEFILEACRKQLRKAWSGKIVSVSLAPIDLGENIVLKGYVRSYTTMVRQIVMALEALDTDIVFFTEHDVLYHPSHFEIIPLKEDVYYYNVNNWRWGVKETYAITYDDLKSLSMLCSYRQLALNHYKARLKFILDNNLDKLPGSEPRWARVMGYEPGTKPKRKGGFSDETFEIWRSELPNIDIRHRHTFSPPKYTKESFKHLPTNWQQKSIEDFSYWNLKELRDKWIKDYEIN